MLGLASRPMFERLGLDLADQPRRFGPFPQAGVAMPFRAGDPPALTRQPVGLADDQHSKLRFAAGRGFVVHIAEDLAQLAHLGPREMVAEEAEHLGIAYRLPRLGGRNQDGPHLGWIRQQSSIAHCGCSVKSTGVSSNTSSLEVLCGHGITSRQRKGPIRSSTPAMLRLGSSP